MFTPQQYRSKAAQYADLMKTARSPAEVFEFQALEQSFTVLANNEQWLADHHDEIVHSTSQNEFADDEALALGEEHVLRCLGAALIMQWDTLPRKLRRELFDNACSMGELADTATLRAQVARFLHKHKKAEDPQAAT